MDNGDFDELVPFLCKQSDYEYIRNIGGGAFGTVDLVKNKYTGEELAEKNIPFEDDDEYATKYFIRELFALYIFRLEGLPFLYFKGFNLPKKINGKKIDAFILTNYIPGGSLSDLIDNEFEDCDDKPTTKMIIIYGICFALKLVHKLKMVHRDLKPDNILLNNNKEPILADFGFARLIKAEINATRRIGTLVYMSPEVIQEEETDDSVNPDCSIDVYSFGVLLLEIIYGKLTFKGLDPFITSNEPKFINHIINGKRFDLPGNDILPDDFKLLIEKCWNQIPLQRWTMKEIIKKLQNNEFVLPGCNIEKYHEYIDRLSSFYQKAKENSKKKTDIDLPDTVDFDFS